VLPLKEACFRLGAEVLLAVLLQPQRQLDLAIQGLSREQLRLAIALECLLAVKTPLLDKILESLTALVIAELLACDRLRQQGLTQKRPQQAVVSQEAQGFGLEEQGSDIQFAKRDVTHKKRFDCNATGQASDHPIQSITGLDWTGLGKQNPDIGFCQKQR
jgi:hypothetical protein